MNPYPILARLFPTRPAPTKPQRIVLVLPCCIGDVVLATATLQALRRGYPDAHITWAVGSWSKPAIEHHDLLDAVLDTGKEALPVRGLWRFVRQLRDGRYDLLVSLVRSPLMSVAALLSGIPHRAGLDSAGRGFGYTIRASIDPDQPRHEADIYLDVARALGLDTEGCRANVPVHEQDRQRVKARLGEITDYIVLNPAGGRNPGMTMDAKRYPPQSLAALGDRLAKRLNAVIILIGGPGDEPLVQATRDALYTPSRAFVGELSFGEIAALAHDARLYVGNDTGLTHLAAAAGAKTVMILGPSDPARYAPFAPDAIALWKPTILHRRGVASGTPEVWD
ncbi:MAG TPA: glycosyltransferase family 9 protein, partial [Oceanobacillus sp.]|nr:glycosyltransferase family 9 protein [Oceanobacillus sp.]